MKRIAVFMMVAVLALSLSAFAGTKAQKTVDLKVEGMTCGACVSKVKGALQKVEGVKDAKVSLEAHNAVVVYDAEKTSEEALVKAINASGFKASGKAMKMDKAHPADCGCEACTMKKKEKES